MSESFTCAECGGTFEKAWSDEEARAEADENFGDELVDPVVVCDDCYQEMVAWKPPTEWIAAEHSARVERGEFVAHLEAWMAARFRERLAEALVPPKEPRG
jgi:hypothetical protein